MSPKGYNQTNHNNDKNTTTTTWQTLLHYQVRTRRYTAPKGQKAKATDTVA
jgi:hypothetical protein